MSMFGPAKRKNLAEKISIINPEAFKASIKELSEDGLTLTEYRALLLAQNRAKAMLNRKNLSPEERKEMREITNIKIPKPTKKR